MLLILNQALLSLHGMVDLRLGLVSLIYPGDYLNLAMVYIIAVQCS